MPVTYRVITRDGVSIGEGDSIEAVVDIVTKGVPGRFQIQKESFDSTTGELQVLKWGGISKSRSGRITLDPPPWLD